MSTSVVSHAAEMLASNAHASPEAIAAAVTQMVHWIRWKFPPETKVNPHEWALLTMKKLAQHGQTEVLTTVTHNVAEVLINALVQVGFHPAFCAAFYLTSIFVRILLYFTLSRDRCLVPTFCTF